MFLASEVLNLANVAPTESAAVSMSTKIRRPRIRIDREFRALIPPLTPGERSQLEENIIAAGRATDPLALWGDVLLDGHNRLDICTKRGLPFTTTQVDGRSGVDCAAAVRQKKSHAVPAH
jgi:hypothetical protein